MTLRTQGFGMVCSILGLLLFGMVGSAGADPGCSNGGIRDAQDSTFLPECRAYELVSPPDKGVGEVAFNVPFAVADAGDRFVFGSFQSFAGAPSAGVVTDYMATRSPQGWSTTAISPPVVSDFQATSNYYSFSSDLSRGVLKAWPARDPLPPLTPDTPAGRNNKWYVRDLPTGGYTLLSTAIPAFGVPPSGWLRLGAVNPDLSHVLFSAEGAQLTPDARPGARNLYEWADGHIRLVSILPDSACGAPPCVASGGEAAGEFQEVSDRAISADGSRAFFQIPALGGIEGLYVREDGSVTKQIGGISAYFLSASKADGSKVLFHDNSCGLCIEDLESPGAPIRLDVDTEPSDGESSFVGVVAASDDLGRVYFGSAGRLNGEGEPGPLVGTTNMYLWDHGTLKFVGYFDEPGVDDLNQLFHAQNAASVGGLIARSRQSDTTPDGSRLIFSSRSQPTGYDNSNPNCMFSNDERCAEVFLYDAEANGGAGGLRCVSCVAGGAKSDSLLMGKKGFGLRSKQRNISIDGRLGFFETKEALIPADTNGVGDVYAVEFSSGGLELISSGTAKDDSTYGGVSSTGSMAFFTTRQRLVDSDGDNAMDVYVASVGGGFEPAAEAAPPCQGEDCQGATGVAPPPATVGSSVVTGAGNVRAAGKAPRRCHAQRGHRRKGKRSPGKGHSRRGAKASKAAQAQRTNRSRHCRGTKEQRKKKGQRKAKGSDRRGKQSSGRAAR